MYTEKGQVSIYGVTACHTVDMQKTGREREAVRVERQRRVGGLEEDINVVHVESSQLQRSAQSLSTRTHNHTRTVKAKFHYAIQVTDLVCDLVADL